MAAIIVCFIFGLLHVSAGNTPPTITCLSQSDIKIKSGATTAALAWKDPQATDTEEGVLTPQLDSLSPKKGSQQGPGTYVITYRVVDKEGLSDTCVFSVRVMLVRCSGILTQHGTSSCRQGAPVGTACTVTCDTGYEVHGSKSITCLDSGQYSAKPGECAVKNGYTPICSSLTTASSATFLDGIVQGFQNEFVRLQNAGKLAVHNGMGRARKRCGNPSRHSEEVCVFWFRFQLFERLKMDMHKHTVKPAGSSDTNSNWHLFTYRRFLMLHPKVNAFCNKPNLLDSHLRFFPDIHRLNNADYKTRFRNTVEGLAKSKSAMIRKQAADMCGANQKGQDCILRDIFSLVDRAELFLTYLDDAGGVWNSDIEKYFSGLTLNTLILKWTYNSTMTALEPKDSLAQQAVITDIVKAIAIFIDEGADDKVRRIMSLFPDYKTDKICNGGTWCLFWRIVDQTRIYLTARQPRNKQGTEVIFLNTELDYREFLQQKQMERVLQLLHDQEYNLVAVAEDLKREFESTINQRFHELKTYFKKVHSFSAAKAKADLVVLDYIDNTNKKAVPLAKEVDSDISKILKAMARSTSLEVFSKIIKLAIVIAENCNPLKVMLDSGGVSEIMAAVDELAEAVANLAKSGKLVAAIYTIRDRAKAIGDGFAKNQGLILAMKTIMESIKLNGTSEKFEAAKDLFLEKYTAYYPTITKADISELTAFFNNVIDEACALIEGTTSAAAAIVKGIVGGKGLCWTTKIKVAKLIQMYESLYDFQFELIEVIASNVQAKVALEAADGIVADYDAVAQGNKDDENVLEKLKQVAGLSFVSYRIMVIQVIRLYCDELQYKAGGIRPEICQDANTDISTLLSYRDAPCTSRALQFQTIGTRRTRRHKAFLDLNKVYAGEVVDFKIPNSKWLYLAGWITKEDMNASIYVSGFEIYLPSEEGFRRDVSVRVEAHGENELVPGGIRYKIMPERPMEFAYRIGQGLHCRNQAISNPYSTCPSKPLPSICPTTTYPCAAVGHRRLLHPSIFSHFRIRVTGYDDLTPPDPVRSIPVKVAVRLCKYNPFTSFESTTEFSEQGKRRIAPTCCPVGQHWYGGKQSCKRCPPGSKPGLGGYYCEKTKSR